MDEFLYMRQLLGRGDTDWLKFVLLLGLLVVLTYRPERIHRPVAFKWACWLIALSIAVPPVLNERVRLLRRRRAVYSEHGRQVLVRDLRRCQELLQDQMVRTSKEQDGLAKAWGFPQADISGDDSFKNQFFKIFFGIFGYLVG